MGEAVEVDELRCHVDEDRIGSDDDERECPPTDFPDVDHQVKEAEQ